MHKLLRKVRVVEVSTLAVLFVLLAGSLKPASAQVITYSSDTSLTSDVFCTDLTIDPGVTLTTNGHNIYCTGTVTNNGVIQTGLVGNGGTGANESPAGATCTRAVGTMAATATLREYDKLAAAEDDDSRGC